MKKSDTCSTRFVCDTNKRFELLEQIIETAGNEYEPAPLFSKIYQVIIEYFLSKHFYITLYNKEKDLATFPFFQACDQAYHPPIKKFSGQSFLLRDVIVKKTPVFADSRTKKGKYLLPCPTSWLGVPIIANHQVLGAMVVQRYNKGVSFCGSDANFLSCISKVLGITLNNIKFQEQLGSTERINKTLFHISDAVNASKSLNELYGSIHNLLSSIVDLPNFYIAMYEPEKGEINFPYFKDEFDDSIPIKIEDSDQSNSLTASIIFEKKSFLYTKKMLEEKKENIIGKTPVIWAGVPLLVSGKAIGAMVVQHYSDPDHFSLKDIQLLEAVSGQIALAIERKKHSDIILNREIQITKMSQQTELFSSVAASILSVEDEQKLFDQIGKAIVEHSDYNSFIITYFKNTPPYRDIIAWAGYDADIIDTMRTQDRPASIYLDLFKDSQKLGRFTYYIPRHKSAKTILGTAAYSEDYVKTDGEDAWHPEDFLFVKMFDGQGNFIGVISVDNPTSGKKPTNETIRPLEVFSSLVSQIIVFRKIQNELNHHKQNLENLVDERTKELRQEIIERKKAQKEREKLIASKREMEIAKNIQTSLLPCLESLKEVNFEISANMTPAEDVGGDYYDLILSPDNKLWFGIGDVTGHGLISGLIMMMAQVSINTLIRSIPNLSPEEVLIYANQVIQSNIREGLKVNHHMTINFIVEEKDGVYRYAGAHEIMLVYRMETKTIEQIPTKGMWLGIIPDISKPIKKYAGRFSLNQGDILFLYTDGVIEICNKHREQYDIHRLERFLIENAEKSTEEIKHRLLTELNLFKHKQMDDITFMIMKKK